jgi:hypothetical protein
MAVLCFSPKLDMLYSIDCHGSSISDINNAIAAFESLRESISSLSKLARKWIPETKCPIIYFF